MSEPTSPSQDAMFTPRKIAVQVIVWLLGLGLLAWVIKGAIEGGAATGNAGEPSAWERIRSAPVGLIVALLGCTLVSAVLNGTTFWITIQPIRAVRWRDMNLLNIFAGMLNYAPVRLGAVLRVAYHMRIDRLSLVQIGGWFALIGYVMFLGIGSCALATLLHPSIDWIWLAIVIGGMVMGAFAIRFIASIPLLARHARGLDSMAMHQRGLWGAVALRLLDLAAYTGRMGAAMIILDMHLAWSNVVVLAMIALVSSLMPVGRLGVREFCVSAAAAQLNMDVHIDKSVWDQLALLESAGEALVYIPLGILAVPWFRARWRAAARRQP